MCQVKLEECEVFIKIIDSMKQFVDKINIHIRSNGLFIDALDNKRVAFVSAFLSERIFSTYMCPSHFVCGLSIDSLDKILDNANGNGSMTFQCKEKPAFLNIIFESKSGKKHSKFSLPLLNLDIVHMEIPQNQFSSTCAMSFDTFNQICRQLGEESETTRIQVNKREMKFTIPEQFAKKSMAVSLVGNDNKTVVQNDEPVCINLSSKFLQLFSKAADLSTQIVLHISNHKPLMASLKFEKDSGRLNYYLAPKILGEEQED